MHISIGKNILKTAGIISLSLYPFIEAMPQKSEKPNILMILVDDHGYGDLSINGGKDIQTPNLDALFRKGTQLTNFYSNCTVCSPTRASLLTGRYPDMVGVPGVIRTHEQDSWGYLRNDVITLPEMLKRANYQTAIIGKWHLGLETPNTPNERGFDHFQGFLGDMMDDYWTHLRHGNNYMRHNNEVINPVGHATDIFTEWTIDYLKSVASDAPPFFLYLAYNAPHFPIQPPDEWLQKVKKRNPELSDLRAKNVAFVEHLDYSIGRVVKALNQLGLEQNTIIVFSSDNGGSLPHGASNGELRMGKQDMYEGGIKVPTCVVWPGKIAPGSKNNNLALTMDLYPTFCELADLEIDHQIDGISILASLLGKTQVTDNRPIFFMRREGGYYGGMMYYAARYGRYKLVQNSPFESLQYFDIITDPYEKVPLDGNLPELKELKFLLSQHIRRSGAIPWQNR